MKSGDYSETVSQKFLEALREPPFSASWIFCGEMVEAKHAGVSAAFRTSVLPLYVNRPPGQLVRCFRAPSNAAAAMGRAKRIRCARA